MNTKRAIWFGVILYIISLVVFGGIGMAMGVDMTNPSFGLTEYAIYWVAMAVVILLLAKWYFRQAPATLKSGILLGVLAIVIALIGDGISILGTHFAGQSTDMFMALYSDWKFYVTVVWVIVVCAYAGYEFDTTYTAPTATPEQPTDNA